jgi:hypothetical protein
MIQYHGSHGQNFITTSPHVKVDSVSKYKCGERACCRQEQEAMVSMDISCTTLRPSTKMTPCTISHSYTGHFTYIMC